MKRACHAENEQRPRRRAAQKERPSTRPGLATQEYARGPTVRGSARDGQAIDGWRGRALLAFREHPAPSTSRLVHDDIENHFQFGVNAFLAAVGGAARFHPATADARGLFPGSLRGGNPRSEGRLTRDPRSCAPRTRRTDQIVAHDPQRAWSRSPGLANHAPGGTASHTTRSSSRHAARASDAEADRAHRRRFPQGHEVG